MSEQEATRAVGATRPVNRYEAGEQVCVTGRGMDNFIHVHGVITRTTATLAIVTTDNDTERRYRLPESNAVNDLWLDQVPRVDYGGTQLTLKCARRQKR